MAEAPKKPAVVSFSQMFLDWIARHFRVLDFEFWCFGLDDYVVRRIDHDLPNDPLKVQAIFPGDRLSAWMLRLLFH